MSKEVTVRKNVSHEVLIKYVSATEVKVPYGTTILDIYITIGTLAPGRMELVGASVSDGEVYLVVADPKDVKVEPTRPLPTV